MKTTEIEIITRELIANPELKRDVLKLVIESDKTGKIKKQIEKMKMIERTIRKMKDIKF